MDIPPLPVYIPKMRGSQVSKPSLVPHSSLPFDPLTNPQFHSGPFPVETNEEIESIQSKLKIAQQQVAEARAQSKDLREAIELKKQTLQQLEELHQVNQCVVVKHEKELSGQRGAKSYHDLVKQKEGLEGSLKTQFEKVSKMTEGHFASLKELECEEVTELSENKVVMLMVAQVRLYQGQIRQRQMDLEQAINRHTRQFQMISSESSSLSTDCKQAHFARLSDMKRILKLLRTEAYTAETIRAHGLKPTDEVAAEATSEVMTRLREKLGPMDENSEFLRSLEEKLKRRGINLGLEKIGREEELVS